MPRRVEGALDDDDAAIRGQSDAFVAKRKDLALLPFAHDAYCPVRVCQILCVNGRDGHWLLAVMRSP
jgi:hypothetical protein